MILRTALILGFLAGAARAQPVQASYATYAAGLNVVNMDATIDVQPDRYKVRLAYRTAGAISLVISSQQETTVEGRFVDSHAVPRQFYSAGTLRGKPRVTQIDYPGGQPTVRQLIPPNDGEREVVAPDRQANTIDTISAMAELVRQVNQSGRCDGRVMTYDGRRLAELASKTLGTDMLPATGRSSFTGQALHCSFDGQQLGGFKLDEDRAKLQKPQHGEAWFASLVPGGPKVPVRILFRTEWFGDATMYLVEKS